MKRLRIPVAVLAAAGLCLYELSQYAQTVQHKDETAFVSEARGALRAGKAYRARIGTLTSAEQLHVARADSTARVSDSLGRLADSLERTLGGDTAYRATTADLALHLTLRSEVATERRAAVDLRVALTAADQQAALAVKRVDELELLTARGADVVAARSRFRLMFLTLPRPPKWLAAMVGCGLGGYLDRADRTRGCGIGGTLLTVTAPTR